MNLVDSCGWVEYLVDGPNAGRARRGRSRPLLPRSSESCLTVRRELEKAERPYAR